MELVGIVLYCNLFVLALYSDHRVEVKPRSLTKNRFRLQRGRKLRDELLLHRAERLSGGIVAGGGGDSRVICCKDDFAHHYIALAIIVGCYFLIQPRTEYACDGRAFS